MSDLTPGSARPVHRGQERFVAPTEETPLRDIDVVDVAATPEGQWREAWKRLRRAPLFWVSVVILVVVALVVAFPGLFTDADPRFGSLEFSRNDPSPGHPFGYNQQGYDVWARTLYGARASVSVGVLATLIAVVLGMITGAIAGFFGGLTDSLLSRFSDIFFSIPLLLGCIVVVTVISNAFPNRGFWASVFTVAGALGAFAWPQITRQMRAAVLETKNLEFVDAATAIGASRMTNLRRHIVPNSLPPVIVAMTISLGVFIVAESALSFLGVGLPQSVPSWGSELDAATNQVRSGQDLRLLYVPATALGITVLGFVLLGESVREALDPRARKS